jgi:hypothetical protein
MIARVRALTTIDRIVQAYMRLPDGQVLGE